MAGEKILGLLALAEQQNTDLQGKGGVAVDPFSDDLLIGNKTVEEMFGRYKKPIPGSNKGFDDLDDATKKYIMNLLNNKKADVKLFDDEGYQLVDGKRAEDWFNEGTGIEKGGFENAPPWLRDQLWKKDLEKRRELGLEPSV